MIIRIVKMNFMQDKVTSFLETFNQAKEQIRNFEGCQHLTLLQSTEDESVFFTYSYWDSEEHLNAYRKSELFLQVWAKTKECFYSKAEAWTVKPLIELP